MDYCGFNNIDELIADHKAIKEQIKEWELQIDKIIDDNTHPADCISPRDELEEISNEMMSINI